MVYRVLADGIDIFGSDTESSLLSPSLETELNSAGSLEFTLPPDHPSYDDISLMQTEIEVYEDDDLIFFGRPSEVSIDWNKQKKVVCEGALAYLNDAAIRPHKFEGALISDVFKYIIAQYNAQVAQNKQFIVGNITIIDRYVYTEFDYDICLSVLISTCIDSTGGYLFLRKEENGIYIDWLAEVPDASDQPVQFASNMLDLNQDTKAEDICTVVLPVGGQVDGVNITIAPVNQGSDILEDSDAIAKYGRILKIQQWNDIVDPQALKDKATEWLAKQQEDDVTIETDAAELHYLDGSVGAYRIGQLVNVISGPHGVDKEYPILKMSMNLDSGTKRITLGTPPRKELTELSGITNSTGGGSSSGGGGTEVEANPSEPATDDLNTIKIGDTVYDIPGGGSNTNYGKFTCDVLFDTPTSSSGWGNPITICTKSVVEEYDILVLTFGVTQQETATILVADLLSNQNGKYYYLPTMNANGGNFHSSGLQINSNNDLLFYVDASGDCLYKVYGLKFENKLINRSDIYSEEERMIGRWTDSKPLYQKTYRNIRVTNNTDNVVDSNFGTDKNICTHDIEFRGISGNSRCDYNTSVNDTLYSNNNGQLVYYFYKSGSWSQIFDTVDITIQYTKTTDQPGSGFLPEDPQMVMMSDYYSEDEQVVGRWTDGKPLYQKTYNNLGLNVSANTWTNTGISFSDVDYYKVVTNKSYLSDSQSQYPMLYRYYQNTFQVFCQWQMPLNELTIQYTKTTDAPGTGPTKGNLIYLPALYSEEEREVGVWTDGKPVYQKTFTGFSVTLQNGQVKDTGASFNNVSTVISCLAITDDNISTIPVAGYCINNTLQMIGYQNGNVINKCVVQYTKTTDQPGSGTWTPEGQLAHHYSTSEKIVGTWIDGSTVYERTIQLTADLTTSDTAWTQVQYDNPVTNMSYLIDCKVLNTTGTYLLERFSNDNGALAAASKQSGTIFRSGTYMIIQYTKSS